MQPQWIKTESNKFGDLSSTISRKLRILLVEDDVDHAMLVRLSLENHEAVKEIHLVRDGQSALDFLTGKGMYREKDLYPRPDIVLLDLRLPKIDGLSVLKAIKSTPEIADIPIVVLTSSSADHDMQRAYENHANSYMVKPLDGEEFECVLNHICTYWSLNKRPAREPVMA